jgi:thiamine-monophosphate kinase
MNFQEFDIIQFLSSFTNPSSAISLGIGDDAALISAQNNKEIAISIDTLNVGIHFPQNTSPYDIGYKALAVSLSDMAAMGAEPFAVLLALSLPESDKKWLQQFAEGFFTLAKKYQVQLIGGDTTRGPLSISTVLQGWTPPGDALLRSGAKPDDLIYVTGTLGDAGWALKNLDQPNLDADLLSRLNRPEPRVEVGIALRSIASAAIDLSDGLAADLSKMLQASQVGATIHTDQLPLSRALKNRCSLAEAQQLALSAGDDYELCFTIAPQKQRDLQHIMKNLTTPIHYIGKINNDSGLKILDEHGNTVIPERYGYVHFQKD